MTELLTAAQMRAIEQAAIDSGEVTGLELMERAGRGVVEAIFEEWPELSKTSHKAVVLCGPGNNGGDGFVVARLLKEWGWEVEVFLYGDASTLPPDARANYERWGELGVTSPLRSNFEASTVEAHVTVDALFGTGLTRPVSDLGLALLDMREQSAIGSYTPREFRFGVAARVVAIDIPSGLCSDSGRIIEEDGFKGVEQDVAAARSSAVDLTVSFHSLKLGHALREGQELCGKTVVKSIGIDGRDCPALPQDEVVRLVVRPDWPGKQGGNHKFSHGHALILSGSSGKGGAARLAARGALRIGAGLVTVAPTPGALQENAARLDAIMLSPVGDAQVFQAVLADERLNALCLGPGLGLERARDLVPVGLAAKRATVLDADALTAFRDDPAALFDMLHDSCVLTPHAGEFARLFPDIAEKLNAPATKGPAYSKVDATREAAARAGCVVLFKGADTVIASPDGQCAINSAAYERSAPWLATAGSGDVLAGFITGLLARGFAPMQAAETAAWLHVECAIEFGQGLIAEDLPEMLPAVFRRLGA
ncbi:NAD(P)H-hydrate dehydratase [Aliiroseovarius marinus]|uniref:NAD(P)H-hydrate dehydratase n=1 Tax=Aliiroseovarius marinus TaxID=2500159 RepID=UPI003D7CEFBF